MAAADINRDFAALRAQRADMDRLWYDVQNLVTAAGSLSLLLWGPKRTKATERAELRASLQVDDTSPLNEPPDLRNHFAHIDQRLDQWWATTTAKDFADRFVAPPGQFPFLDPNDVFRSFDPATGLLTFWGSSYSMVDIVREVERIYPLAQAEAAKPHVTRP